jgi:phage shock protein PspC (stress-responsive transcriptional regulator)
LVTSLIAVLLGGCAGLYRSRSTKHRMGVLGLIGGIASYAWGVAVATLLVIQAVLAARNGALAGGLFVLALSSLPVVWITRGCALRFGFSPSWAANTRVSGKKT